jgi:ketosteroid isomerase-like protein
MSVDQNRQLIKEYFDAINRADEEAILALFSDDFRFECMAVMPERFHVVWDKATFAAAPRQMSRMMAKPIQIALVNSIAEGDSMSVEAKSHGELTNGKIYQNAYNFVFTFKDGKISSCKEYSCSYLADHCFGEYEQAFD